MQATVSAYDDTSGTGQVLLDDGSRLPFDAAAFRAGRARLLRVGQRVTLEVITGRIVRVSLPPFI